MSYMQLPNRNTSAPEPLLKKEKAIETPKPVALVDTITVTATLHTFNALSVKEHGGVWEKVAVRSEKALTVDNLDTATRKLFTREFVLSGSSKHLVDKHCLELVDSITGKCKMAVEVVNLLYRDINRKTPIALKCITTESGHMPFTRRASISIIKNEYIELTLGVTLTKPAESK